MSQIASGTGAPKPAGNKKPTGKAPADPTKLFESINLVVESIKEYNVIREQEETKREDIRARRDAAVAAINAQKELLMSYMEHAFAERSGVIQKLFATMDQAIATGDYTLLDRTLGGILTTVQSSPFANLADFRRQLQDKNQVLEI
jgi:hypothetical protein